VPLLLDDIITGGTGGHDGLGQYNIRAAFTVVCLACWCLSACMCVCAAVFAVLQEEETLSFLLLQVETWEGM
jgi:hypothetical protein